MENTNNHLAAIDVGTNSFHLIIVKLMENGNFEIIDREKEVIRLGLGSSPDMKHIQPDAMQRAVETLSRFKKIADSYNANIRAVATSAVRESLNREEFIDTVYKQTGIEIEIISGLEEARLIYLGVLKAVPVYNKKILCIDIGGGSTEFIVGYQGKMLYANSLKLGAVRLSKKFFPDYELTRSSIEECREWVSGEIFHVIREIKKLGFDTFIGCSGTIMSSALMIQAKKTGNVSENIILNNYIFSRSDLQKVTDNLLSKTALKERMKISGLDEKRADIIPAGMIIFNTILNELDVKEVTVSGYALREGIILDSIHKMGPGGGSLELDDIKFSSIKQLAEMCNYDKTHSFHVASLALQLFDQLKPVHKLDINSREYLEAAAILHDIGYHLSHSQHHKHSYYIIRNGEILGFNENEIEIIANVARYHRKSHPKSSHRDFDKLPEKSRSTIKALSSLLRIADSLDRTHSGAVKNIKAGINMNGSKVKTLELCICYSGSYPEIELWNLERRKLLFEEVFNCKVKVTAEEITVE